MPTFLDSLLFHQPAPIWFVAAAFLVVVVRTLIAASARARWNLVACVLIGGAARVLFAPVTLLGMSNYERVPSFFYWCEAHGLNPYAIFPDGLDRWQEIHAFNLIVSCTLPLLVFMHARLLFEDDRIASRASFFSAIAPIPIYFARSDAMFIWSMAISSVCLILLQAAYRARTALGDVFYGVAVLLSMDAVLNARQVNFLFGAVAILSASQALFRRPPRWWLKLLTPIAMLLLSLAHFWSMAVALAGGATDPAVVASTIGYMGGKSGIAYRLLEANNYLVPTMTPLFLTVLAVIGAWYLWKNDRARWVYVVGWFAVFYLGHGVQPAWNNTAMCRYALHTVIPLCLLAAVGLGMFWDNVGARWWAKRSQQPAWVKLAVVGVLLFTTWLGLGLFREPVSDVQQEYAFLRTLSEQGTIEPGATIVENYGDPDRHFDEGGFFALRGRPRFHYFGYRSKGGDLQPVFRLATLGTNTDGPVYLYEGLPCFWRAHADQEMADSCRAARAGLVWEPVATLEITGARHDHANGRDAKGKTIGVYRRVTQPPLP